MDGEGATHNNLFRISGDELQVGGSISPEDSFCSQHPSASHRCRWLEFRPSLSITITDAPDAPTDIELDGNSIKKFERTGTLIGSLTAVDGDEDDSHTFHLVSGMARGTMTILY